MMNDIIEPPYPHVPIGAEARGKLRAWRRETLKRYNQMVETTGSVAFARLGDEYISKKGIGRERAWKKLSKLLGAQGCHLQWTHKTGNEHHAVWAALHPDKGLTTPQSATHPSLTQDSVTVKYLVIGGNKHSGAKLSRGVWSLEVPDHALLRLVQRDRQADIGKVILEAHQAALRMPYARAPKNTKVGFNLPAGDGVFMCKLYVAEHAEEEDNILVAVRPWTWLHHDQLTPGQERLLVKQAAPGQYTMGDTLLLPKPLWREDGESDDA